MDFDTITEQGHILKDERPKNWFWDYNAVFDNSILSAHAKLVRLYLARCTGANRSAWPSLNTIARKCSISKPTAKKAISELIDSGWLVKVHRKNISGECMSNVYTLTCPSEVAGLEEPLKAADGAAAVSDANCGDFEGGGFCENPPVKSRTGSESSALCEFEGGGQAQNPPVKSSTSENAINQGGVGNVGTHVGSHVAPINTHISNILIPQQPISDLTSIVDRDNDAEKDVVVVGDTPVEIISAPESDTCVPSQDEIHELIEFAVNQSPREIILSPDRASEIILKAGTLDKAKEKIVAAGAFVAKEIRAGREINTMDGVMIHIMKLDTGGIKLGRKKPDERKKRLAELDEEKYGNIYLS